MNDLKDLMDAVGPLALVLITPVMYVFAAQLMNDPACVSLDSPGSQVFGKGLIKVLMLCWW